MKKEKILNISINSIVNEKIKKIELLKYYKEIKINIEYSNILLKRIYRRQGLEDGSRIQCIYFSMSEDNIRKKIRLTMGFM